MSTKIPRECGGVSAAVSATHAAAGPTPRALLRLYASLGQTATEARGDVVAETGHRRGRAAGAGAVASALSALRALHARARRFTAPAGPRPAALHPMNAHPRPFPSRSRRALLVAGGSFAFQRTIHREIGAHGRASALQRRSSHVTPRAREPSRPRPAARRGLRLPARQTQSA